MTTRQESLETPWFITNYVLAAIDDSAKAKDAVNALKSVGFHAEDIQNLPGDTAVDQMNLECEQCGAIKHIARMMWSYISIQGTTLKELEKQGESGSHILAVHVAGSEEAKLAAQTLLTYQAHHVQNFGPLGEVIEFTPESV